MEESNNVGKIFQSTIVHITKLITNNPFTFVRLPEMQIYFFGGKTFKHYKIDF